MQLNGWNCEWRWKSHFIFIFAFIPFHFISFWLVVLFRVRKVILLCDVKIFLLVKFHSRCSLIKRLRDKRRRALKWTMTMIRAKTLTNFVYLYRTQTKYAFWLIEATGTERESINRMVLTNKMFKWKKKKRNK